jgi:hypothetical protein
MENNYLADCIATRKACCVTPLYDNNSIEQMHHEGERIVYIEYQDGIPHEVLTASESGYLSWFDFNYFYSDKKDIRWYESGGGGHMTEIQAPHYVKGTKGVVYWMAEGAKFKGKPRNCKRIDSPLLIEGYLIASINPFDISDETSNYGYCDRCNQHVVDECQEHQYWDDENSCVRYYDNGEVAE